MLTGQTISHYRILDRLGGGGMGIVYAAEDLILGRTVAIKLAGQGRSTEKMRERLLEEARAASALEHQNIARIYECGEDEGRLFIAMELVKGRTLSEMIRESPMSATQAMRVVEDVLAALAEAHKLGIVHRDIKPSNVMIDQSGVVKVLDFGLVKRNHLANTASATPNNGTPSDSLIDDTQTTPMQVELTEPGQVMGTPSYMSPEHARDLYVDGRSDVFSCGSLLYACLTGHAPFRGNTAAEILGGVLHVTPQPLSSLVPGIPAGLDEIAFKALSKDPARRYQTAEEMRLELHALRSALTGTATQSANWSSGAPATRTETITIVPAWLKIGAIAVIAAIIALIALVAIPVSPEIKPQAKRWYDEGVAALRDGTYYTAAENLRLAAEADDRFLLTHAHRAEALAEIDATERAQNELLLATRDTPTFRRLPRHVELRLSAVRNLLTRDLQASLAAYRELADAVPAEERSRAQADLGRAYERLAESSKAIEAYGKAIELDPQYAAAYWRRGALRGRQRDGAIAAEADFARAQTIYEATRNLEGLAEVDYQRGIVLTLTGRYEDAKQALTRSKERAENFSNAYQQIRASLQLAVVEYRTGGTTESAQIAQAAILRARQAGMNYLTAWGLVDLGNSMLTKGDLVSAEATLREAVTIAEEGKLPRSLARARLSLSSALVQASRGDEALPLLQSAVDFYTKGSFQREADQARQLLGRVHRNRAEFDQARAIYESMKADAAKRKDQPMLAVVHAEMANLASWQERFADALAAFEQRYALVRDSGRVMDVAYSLGGQVAMLSRLGDAAGAKRLLAELERSAAGVDGLRKAVDKWRRDVLTVSGDWAALEQSLRAALRETAAGSDEAAELRTDLVSSLVWSGRGAIAAAEAAALDAAAEKAPDQMRRSLFRLSVALALLERDPAGSLSRATAAHEYFRKIGLHHSAWRAAAVAAASLQQMQRPAEAAQWRNLATEAIDTQQRLLGRYAAAYTSAEETRKFAKLATVSLPSVTN